MASWVCSSPRMEQLHCNGPTGKILWIITICYSLEPLDKQTAIKAMSRPKAALLKMLIVQSYFFGVCAGVETLSMTEDEMCLLVMKVSPIDVSMKRMAHQVVSRENTVAVPRGPNAVWLPIPPNVAAISALFPCCNSTTTISTAQTIT